MWGPKSSVDDAKPPRNFPVHYHQRDSYNFDCDYHNGLTSVMTFASQGVPQVC